MSGDSLDIKIHGEADFSELDKEFQKFSKKAKKGVDVNLRPKSKNKKSELKEKKDFYETGSRIASKNGSDLDETEMGGFAGVIERKLDTFQEIKEKFKKKRKEEGSSAESIESGFSEIAKSSNLKSFSISKAEIKIQNANLSKLSGISASGTGGGAEHFGSSGAAGKTTEAASSSLPYVGIGLALAGGILKIISSVGERYTQAILSQSSTYSATGGYVSGGGGYFKNAEIAQANVNRGRVTGESVFGKTNPMFEESVIKFSASQSKGIAEVVHEIELLRKENKNLDVGFVRGAANMSGFSNLKQSEFLSRLTAVSESLRKSGYSGDTESFAKFTAGISRKDGVMDPNRKFDLAEELASQGRKGVFGGGIFGALSMSESLKSNNGDFFKAIRDLEKNPGAFISSALNGLDPNTKGILGKIQGSSFTEFENLHFNPKEIQKDNSKIEASNIEAMRMGNETDRLAAGKGGEAAAKIAYQLNESMRQLFEKQEKAFTNVANAISSLEEVALEKLSGQINGLVSMGERLLDKDVLGAIAESFSALKNLTSISGLLVRTK